MIDLTYSNPPPQWLYYKLYLSQWSDRSDPVVIRMAQLIDADTTFSRWFYLRYFDESGVHLRVRLLPQEGTQASASSRAEAIFAILFEEMRTFAASSHMPMVAPPGMEHAPAALMPALGGVRAEPAQYEPEYEKYGGPIGMPIAEELFLASSRIAAAVLSDEAAGQYSRKALVPSLMRACHATFEPAPAARFWNRYCMFWLGGDSPAAEDWHQKFWRKGEELKSSAIAVCPEPADLNPQAALRLQAWIDALSLAKQAYALRADDTGAALDVLCFNFAHMMNNRLGLTSLEEPYMATLLEQADTEVAA